MNPTELPDQCLSLAGAEETFPLGSTTSVFKGRRKDVRAGETIREMIEDSYDLVLGELPPARRRSLGWRDDP